MTEPSTGGIPVGALEWPGRFQAFTNDELHALWYGLVEYDGSYYLPPPGPEYVLAVEMAAEAKTRGLGLPTNRDENDMDPMTYMEGPCAAYQRGEPYMEG